MAQQSAPPVIRGLKALRRQLQHLRRWLFWRERFLWLEKQLHEHEPVSGQLSPVCCYSFEERWVFLRNLPPELALRLARLWEALPQSWVFTAGDALTPVAYYCFVTVGTVWIEEFAMSRHFDAGEAYVHTCYTLPPHRGRGLHSRTLQVVCHWLSERDFQRAFAVVSERNQPSLRGFLRAGFRRAGSVVHYRLLGHVMRSRAVFSN